MKNRFHFLLCAGFVFLEFNRRNTNIAFQSIHSHSLKLNCHFLPSPNLNVKLNYTIWLNPHFIEVSHQLLKDILRALKVLSQLLMS